MIRTSFLFCGLFSALIVSINLILASEVTTAQKHDQQTNRRLTDLFTSQEQLAFVTEFDGSDAPASSDENSSNEFRQDSPAVEDAPAESLRRNKDEAATEKSSSDADEQSPESDNSAEAADGIEPSLLEKSGVTLQPQEPELAPLTPEMVSLRDDLEACLAYYYARPESVTERSPWGIMHALISYGVDTTVRVGNDEMNAIGWLSWNRPCRGMRLFRVYTNGTFSIRTGPGFQGHEGQFLAMLAQSKVRSDYELKMNGQSFTVEDVIKYEQNSCKPKTELTFKLIGLVHYLDTDATWTSSDGQEWDFERLLEEELAQEVIGAACGGTHRMMGFGYAVNKRMKEGKPITGQWLRAQKFVGMYHDYTFKLQNRDGSFSTKWFEGREALPDVERRIQTTGHILEWMVYTLPREDLQDPRVVKAVEYLTRTMWRHRNLKWEIGPRGHALRALMLYDQYVFGRKAGDGGAHLLEVAKLKGLTR